MCLAIPGKVLDVARDALDVPMGRVSYGGVVKEACFSCLPDAMPGDWVLVHVGFAISRLDEAEAQRTLKLVDDLSDEVPRRVP